MNGAREIGWTVSLHLAVGSPDHFGVRGCRYVVLRRFGLRPRTMSYSTAKLN